MGICQVKEALLVSTNVAIGNLKSLLFLLRVMLTVGGSGGGGKEALRQMIVLVSPVNQIAPALGLNILTLGYEPINVRKFEVDG